MNKDKLIDAMAKKILNLEEEKKQYIELCLYLVSEQYKLERLQRESYSFLDDDKKMAEHFRLSIPITQGLNNQMIMKKIHRHVQDKGSNSGLGKAFVSLENYIDNIVGGNDE